MSHPDLPYAVIGAGPSGLAAARSLAKRGVPFVGFESHTEVGGLWNIDNPRSTVYESAHLISSRTTTEFSEFPMTGIEADYPSHRELQRYFAAYADRFGLREHFRFGTRVVSAEPVGDGTWRITWERADAPSTGSGGETGSGTGNPETELFAGVILATGTLATPAVPSFAGEFAGELLHTAQYKHPQVFAGKRVLVIGAGNSGCDIAVDAVHYASSVDMSVRRGYYFVPKYILGRPSDTFTKGKPLPRPIKQFVDKRMLRVLTGRSEQFGFPAPDYDIYESHPVVNSLILHHIGQGDVRVRKNVDRFDGRTVHFTDGTSGDYDLIMLATGYALDYAVVGREHLNWTSATPELFLNIFHPEHTGLFVLGMIEASGIGWQGRSEQAELLATYLAGRGGAAGAELERLVGEPWPDLTGGYKYLGLDRMAYYVDKHTYRTTVTRTTARLEKALRQAQGADARSLSSSERALRQAQGAEPEQGANA